MKKLLKEWLYSRKALMVLFALSMLMIGTGYLNCNAQTPSTGVIKQLSNWITSFEISDDSLAFMPKAVIAERLVSIHIAEGICTQYFFELEQGEHEESPEQAEKVQHLLRYIITESTRHAKFLIAQNMYNDLQPIPDLILKFEEHDRVDETVRDRKIKKNRKSRTKY